MFLFINYTVSSIMKNWLQLKYKHKNPRKNKKRRKIYFERNYLVLAKCNYFKSAFDEN